MHMLIYLFTHTYIFICITRDIDIIQYLVFNYDWPVCQYNNTNVYNYKWNICYISTYIYIYIYVYASFLHVYAICEEFVCFFTQNLYVSECVFLCSCVSVQNKCTHIYVLSNIHESTYIHIVHIYIYIICMSAHMSYTVHTSTCIHIVHIYIYIIYISTYILMYIIYIYIHIIYIKYMHIHMYSHIYIYTNIHIYTYIHMYLYTYMCV